MPSKYLQLKGAGCCLKSRGRGASKETSKWDLIRCGIIRFHCSGGEGRIFFSKPHGKHAPATQLTRNVRRDYIVLTGTKNQI